MRVVITVRFVMHMTTAYDKTTLIKDLSIGYAAKYGTKCKDKQDTNYNKLESVPGS